MGLTELFNEWIVERGSAKVQEKHIALFRDQLAMADKKVALLEKENEKLKSDLQESQKENKILRSKIQEYEQPSQQSSHGNLLDNNKLEILKLLFKQQNLQEEQIAQALKMDLPIVKFHLGELQKRKFVTDSYPRSRNNHFIRAWSLAHEGTGYLLENGIST